MQQASSPTTATLQSPSIRKSLFTRISSPFGSKSRTVAEFTVQADDPHRRYAPGDSVKGTVILKLLKAVRVTHIVVCLHGFVQVYKTPGGAPTEGFRAHNNLIGKGRGNRRGEYFGNGFATLFEDERVICGDGRLEEGNYKFEFKMRFPDETLPSSIDFERGTISYMVTATMTRPNSMAPLVFHDQKISFAERIDVAKLLPPKARTITLEPLIKRSQTKSTSSKRRAGQSDSMRQDDGSGSHNADGRSVSRSQASTTGEYAIGRSPSPSIRSTGSRQSSNRHTSDSVRSSRASDCGSALQDSASTGRRNQTITVQVESLRGGTMRGDTIPLRVVVNHTKHVKSMQGVIVTLYRQARVDTHPALPLGPTTDGEKRKFEDYYPKSLTGLGGLSLSAAGSSHIFRKDLSQIVLPLIVDPQTLMAELAPKLRVPDDAFPTIACVPGAMISFKYYLEVILDIQGKLAGQDRYFAQAGAENTVSAPPDASTPGGAERWGPHPYIDTAAIRRDKSVVACVLEIVVGTHDSDRKKGKERAQAQAQAEQVYHHHAAEAGPSTPYHRDYQTSATNHEWLTDDYFHAHGDYDPYYEEGYDPNYAYDPTWYNGYDAPPDFYPPEFEPPIASFDDSNLSEKERARRAEALLLPSQPPAGGESTMMTDVAEPSAPSMDFDFGLDSYQRTGAQPSPLAHSAWSPHTAASSSRARGAADGARPNAPRYSQIEPSRTAADSSSCASGTSSVSHNGISRADYDASSVGAPPTAAPATLADDKDEILRRELAEQASRPPAAPAKDDYNTAMSRGAASADRRAEASADIGPSVPSSSELEEMELQAAGAEEQARGGGDAEGALPRYER
ncbi:hypothetical protein B9Z65_2741 [Elsinoe australis]|uniref:Arrestin-like N-terminal domain-containing protein n=1 Tax=Elsinoe australis TaxID=40998 RepID=A0A2P8A4F7_9PEZI|nr:hypothetical protein B9Z65_2741 [Elsinoe australis]